MDKKLFKSLILLITYTVLLVAVLMKIDHLLGWGRSLLSALQPLFIGFAIAFILHRPCRFFTELYERHLPRRLARLSPALAVVSSYAALILAITLLILLVVPELVSSIQTFIGNMSTYTANLQGWMTQVVEALDLEALADLNLSATIQDALKTLLSGVLNALTTTLPQLISVTSVVVSAVVTGVVSLVFSIYMLSGSRQLLSQLRRLIRTYLPRRLSQSLFHVARLTADTFTKFISGQLLEGCILGSLCFVGMSLFRFDYAPLISVIIGVSALIPVAGAYVGAIVAALLLVMISPVQALWFLVFLLILQQLEGNLIYPRVVGGSIGLPGIWVLAAVTVGGGLLGFLGMLLGVPVTAVLYTLLKHDVARREGQTPAP